MPGRLAFDFGTSNTLAALWDPERRTGQSLALADLTRPLSDPHGGSSHAAPSFIHYHAAGLWTGQQVIARQLQAATPGTFRLMKSYVVAQGLRIPRQLFGRSVDEFQAAHDFLVQILIAAGGAADFAEEEVAFTHPVMASAGYCQWLDAVARAAGIQHPRYLDEASAAALGHAARIKTDQPFLTFDFGGGSLDVCIVRVDDSHTAQPRCRVIAKEGAALGGSFVDRWLVREILCRAHGSAPLPDTFPPELLQEAERVKESLSAAESATFSARHPTTGAALSQPFSRAELEALLARQDFFAKVTRTLELVERRACEYGYGPDTLQTILMVGGSSLIPSVRRLVAARYPGRVRCERPFDAVAVGAAAWIAGAGFEDRIRHTYALRHFCRVTGKYQLQTIVPAGTPYPGPVMRSNDPRQPLILTLKASHLTQSRLGLQVFELADANAADDGGVILVFDPDGQARYLRMVDATERPHTALGAPTYLFPDPPARQGEPRFLARFSLNARRELCATVQDLHTRQIVRRDLPLATLA